MKIAYLQKTTLIDYPGKVACTIFTQGCNFRCGYCHNPELVLPDKFLDTIETENIFTFLNKRKGKLQGVCITGGEPTIHRDLPDFIKKIKNLGYLVKLDTNGSNPEMLIDLLKQNLLDMVAMDIKGPISRYEDISKPKVDIKKIEKSVEIIKNSDIKYEFRTTVVKDQLTKSDFEDIGNLLSGAKNYYLQKFISTKAVDETFLKKSSYEDKFLKDICVLMNKYNVNCSIR